MLTPDQIEKHVRPKLAIMQLISAAMLVGVLAFLGVICTIVDWTNLNQQFKMLSLIGTVTGILILCLSIAAPRVLTPTQGVVRSTDSEPVEMINGILNSLISANLIRFVLIEAALFLNLMVFMIEPHRSALIIVGVGILLMLICFPRKSNWMATLENRIA